ETNVTGTNGNDDDVSGGVAGVLAGSVSLNGDATTTVNLTSDIRGDNGVIAIAGSINGDPETLLDLAANPSDFQNLLSGAAGEGKATVTVNSDGAITADNAVGVLALGIGTENEVTATSTGNIVANGDMGIGMLAGSIGEGGVVNANVHDVNARL